MLFTYKQLRLTLSAQPVKELYFYRRYRRAAALWLYSYRPALPIGRGVCGAPQTVPEPQKSGKVTFLTRYALNLERFISMCYNTAKHKKKCLYWSPCQLISPWLSLGQKI